MDWQVFHWLNGSLRGHGLVAEEIQDFVLFWAVPVFAVATFGLWFLDRPGARYRWKLACLSALASAGLGLLVSQVITHFWDRPRPFVAHPSDTLLLVSPSGEPSFPSDHAVAAFAIAFSVLFVGRRTGALFLAAATTVALTRVFVGLHYPGDVGGGAVIGFICALVVFRFTGGFWTGTIRLISRVTDPVARPAWDAFDRHKYRRRVRQAAAG